MSMITAADFVLAWDAQDDSLMHVMQAFTPGGTVSQHVVSHASCPVLVLPAKAVSWGCKQPPYACCKACMLGVAETALTGASSATLRIHAAIGRSPHMKPAGFPVTNRRRATPRHSTRSVRGTPARRSTSSPLCCGVAAAASCRRPHRPRCFSASHCYGPSLDNATD